MTRLARTTIIAALLSAAGAATADVSVTPAATLATAQRPAGVAIADFNGDGTGDLAVATDDLVNIDRILIFRGAGDGTFAAPTAILTGNNTGPDSMQAGDFDGDGDTDIAVVLNNISVLQLYLNDGTGNFTAGSSVSVGLEARSLRAADLNGDGFADFLTANRDGLSVSVVQNNAGTLSAAATLPIGGETRGVAAGDFDGDGDADIVASDRDAERLVIFTNNGGFSFTQTSTITNTLGDRPSSVDAEDINGDGLDDIVTTIFGVAVYTNTGAGFSAPAVVAAGGLGPDEVRLVDLNGDGARDLVWVNQDSNSLAMAENQGTGTFGAAATFAAGARPNAIGIGFLNADGLPDLAVSNRDSNNTNVYLNASGPIDPPPPTCVADADGNGVIDSGDFFLFIDQFINGCPN